MVINAFNKIKSSYVSICQAVGAIKVAPSAAHVQFGLIALGVASMVVGLEGGAIAQSFNPLQDHNATYNTSQIDQAVTVLFTFLEGSLGALIAVGAGIMAIISSAFGQYKAALSCLIVAVGAFILRSFVFTWFNVETIDPSGGVY